MSRKVIGLPPAPLGRDSNEADFFSAARKALLELQFAAAAAASTTSSTATGTAVAGPIGPVGPPGPPAAAPTPDLTPPPTPGSVVVTAGIDFVFITTEAPTFTEGHGYNRTIVYGDTYGGTGPLPTFADAVVVHEFVGQVGSFAAEPGVQWHIWLKWRSNDGVLSTSPQGGANGNQVTTAKIGNANLGPLIIEAGQLADGSVTATKLAAQAVGLTAFAAGIEPISVVAALPSPSGYTGPKTVFLTTDGKLYRYSAGAWSTAVPAADVTGQLTDAQLASISAAKLTGQITGTQITDGAISTPKLAAGSVTAAQIAADTITAAQIAASAITATELAAGSVTTAKLVASAVTANELAANSVVAGKIAAAAVNADQIAVGAIRAQHMLIAPKSLWPDPDLAGGATNYVGFVRRLVRTDPAVPAGCPMQYAAEIDGRDTWGNILTPCRLGEQFKVSFWWNRGTSSGAGVYPEILWWNSDGQLVTGQLTGTRTDIAGWVYVTGTFEVPFSTYVGCSPGVYMDEPAYVGTGWVTDLTLEKVNDASLIVDGAITATKIAANAIAVGTAAIQNGAIVNAMIGDAQITSAKIVSLAASKIIAGSIAVGEYIQSSDFVTGVSGWRLGGNTAELGAGNIRGTLLANQIAAWSISAGRAIIADGTITDAKIETLTASKITTGTLTGQTLTGGVIQTASSGQRVVLNESGSNEARFYGDRGDGTIVLLASIGVNTTAYGDPIVGYFGSPHSANLKSSVYAEAYWAAAVVASSQAGNGINAFSTSANAVSAISSGTQASVYASTGGSGSGVSAGSLTGYGGEFRGNLTSGSLMLTPLAGRPSNRAAGQLAMINTSGGTTDNRTGAPYLMMTNGDGQWRFTVDMSVFSG